MSQEQVDFMMDLLEPKAGQLSLELVADDISQKELSELGETLRQRGVPFSQLSTGFEAAGGGDYLLPGYFVAIKELGPPVIAAIAAGAGAWVQARFGRKVRLKVGDIEAEGRSVEEIESLLKKVAEYRDREAVKDSREP